MAVVQASDEGSRCDACGTTFDEGLVLDVALRPYDEDSALSGLFTVCESCFEDVTSDMGVQPTPGERFLVLVDADEMFEA